MGGIFAQEIQACLCSLEKRPKIFGYLVGLGGRDVTPETIMKIVKEVKERQDSGYKHKWIGVKGLKDEHF
jgi:pyruvate/2-oxoacid:ferredoxin oxidoreductase alpha subunit